MWEVGCGIKENHKIFPVQMHNFACCQDLCARMFLLLQLHYCNKSQLNLTVALKWVGQLGAIRVGISLTKERAHMDGCAYVC